MSTSKRQYSSAVRDQQADETRRRIVAAAKDLLIEKGYSGTTVDAVAKAAGVSLQTVYNSVGGKPVVLKAAYDVMLAGDQDPIPINERPAVVAMRAATDPREALTRYARFAREINARVGPLLWVVLAQAAAGDEDLQEFAATTERERLIGSTGHAKHLATTFGLRPGLTPAAAADIIWTMSSPEVARLLVEQRGWSWTRYEHWLADTLTHALLG
jgi:AcrR family transcriptional regulator